MGLIFNRPSRLQTRFKVSPRAQVVREENAPPVCEKQEKLFEFVSFLAEHDIHLVMVFGTALGAIREQGIIPHDDDIDTGFYEADIDKLGPLLPALEEKGFYLQTVNPFNLGFYMVGFPDTHLDMYLMKKTSLFYRVQGKRWFCDHGLYAADFFNPDYTEEVPFYDRSIRVPAQHIHYLETLYGPDWRTPKKGHNAVYRSRLSQLLNFCFFDSHQPLAYAGLKRQLVFKPWVSFVIRVLLRNPRWSQRYQHPSD